MKDFIALSGIEYDVAKAGDFSTLLSPPYDVVDESLRSRLAARNPYNVVRIILPEPSGSMDRYQAAAALVKTWQEAGVLAGGGRAFYVLEQRFELEGRLRTRTALLGRLRLSPWRENGVFPHEVTLPKPKADRLSLYRAAHVQPGPVFALFRDQRGAVATAMDEAKKSVPYRVADGPLRDEDRVWKISDQSTIDLLENALAGEHFFIADGHHRYETALAYREETARGASLPEDHPANFALAAVVTFDDPGLVILPTHRLVRLDSGASIAGALDGLARDYDIEEVRAVDARDALNATSAPIVLYSAKRWRFLRLKDGAREALVKEAGALMAGINVYEARSRVLSCFFPNVDKAADEEHIGYTHDLDDAIAGVDGGGWDAAVMLAPLSVSTVAAVASAGSIMPPKSTFFYPKIPTGIVLNPLQ